MNRKTIVTIVMFLAWSAVVLWIMYDIGETLVESLK